MTRSLARVALLAAAALAPTLARAHDLWLERRGDGLVLRLGHRGRELLPIDAARLKAARCVDGGATRDLLPTARFAPREVELRGRCPAASAFLDGGFWTLTPDGEVNRPRSAVPQAVKAWASRQYAKWVEARSTAASSAVLGDELEVVPASDLARARPGDEITVRVLSRGEPVAGAVVESGHRRQGQTDRRGELRVRLRAPGVETIGATVRRKLATPDADQLVLEASLSFEVAR